ncbi:PREDICTED: phosphatidylinositol N-acetylglucosaminyltransferase subunit Q [Papilio xuthus]|uniref:Phosphatidylinositol N-acetylglucosaminyltransferase subunit Q n=1 Tax=Papilio xuthus TaxID=66420 RepID=A0AAJ7EAD8_PAPXU|nr:PREDICTED: phosphatidylinositol N-acetylglucosaminyltransferase subunit Q [Papilio xuthus]
MSSLRLILPIKPKSENSEIYFKGYIQTNKDNLTTIYVTKCSKSYALFEETSIKADNAIYGYYSNDETRKFKFKPFTNCLIISDQICPQIQYLSIDGRKIKNIDSCIIISYDPHSIKNSETLKECNDFIFELQTLVRNDYREDQNRTDYEATLQNPSWLVSSMFIQHVFNYLNMIIWLIISIRRNRKISMKEGNFILSVLVDITIGYFILELLLKDKKDLGVLLMGILEKLVNLMYTLLKWLMGSPAGLKLNNAFNKMLGRYFSYHIELWWLFLDVSGEKLNVILHLYRYIGYLGFTFQAAIIADMICVATFHSYCIYVYAARLFNIQISGLIALLRLFVGRKYNPLRGGIDSCEYTNQELFVGTVAFTILLLLLPTTVMYYTVFTMFRVLSMLVQYILAKCIYLVQTLPLYVFILWIIKSTKVAGNVFLEVVKNDETSLLVLQIKLLTVSLQDLINNFKPPVEVSKHVEWSNIVSNIVTGKQII